MPPKCRFAGDTPGGSAYTGRDRLHNKAGSGIKQ